MYRTFKISALLLLSLFAWHAHATSIDVSAQIELYVDGARSTIAGANSFSVGDTAYLTITYATDGIDGALPLSDPNNGVDIYDLSGVLGFGFDPFAGSPGTDPGGTVILGGTIALPDPNQLQYLFDYTFLTGGIHQFLTSADLELAETSNPSNTTATNGVLALSVEYDVAANASVPLPHSLALLALGFLGLLTQRRA